MHQVPRLVLLLMNRFPCRCRQCGARRTLGRRPEHHQREPRCNCGGTYRVDWYRRSKEHLKAACYCDGYPWAIDNAPHRRGSPECYHR